MFPDRRKKINYCFLHVFKVYQYYMFEIFWRLFLLLMIHFKIFLLKHVFVHSFSAEVTSSSLSKCWHISYIYICLSLPFFFMIYLSLYRLIFLFWLICLCGYHQIFYFTIYMNLNWKHNIAIHYKYWWLVPSNRI